MRFSFPRTLIVTSCLFLAATLSLPAAVTITATNDDGTPAATKKNPGENVTYTIQINSTGSNDATGVTLTDPTAANTAEVGGSLNVTPVAVDDTYPQTVQANTAVDTNVVAGFDVLTNDYPGVLAGTAVLISNLTITAFDAASVNGGTVNMTLSGANKGKFVYVPPAGFTGTDSFTYTISNGVAGTPAGSATGKVTITVVGPVIWFVDDSAPPGGNGTWTGTNSKAFQTVAQAAGVDAANHRIFLASGTYTNGIVLNSGEWVVGEGASGTSFDTVMGITYGSETVARPAINGTKPAWSAAAGSSVVTLADNDTILGVAITGNSVPAVTGTSVNTGLIGNATTTDTTITSVAGGGFFLSGGSGAIGMNATISSTVGHSVSISGRGAGVVTLSRAVSDTGTGILLDNNDQSGVGTITFTGGLNISTGVNAAFTATNGGIVNATQDNNTIVNTLATTTATALNVNNTTIGGSGLTFRSISAGTGSGSAGIGIILDTTGSSGGLTVTGNGGTCTFATPTCDGGTIQHKTGADSVNTYTSGLGIYLNNTSSVSLTRMHLHDFDNGGIRGRTVNGFTLQTSVVDGANGTCNSAACDVEINNGEDSIRFTNLTGSALIDSCFIGGGFADNVRVINNSGTLNRLTISNSTIGDLDGAGPQRGLAANAQGGQDDLNFESKDGISAMNVTVSNNTLNYGVGDIVQASNNDNTAPIGTMDVVVRGNTIVNSNAADQVNGASGITIAGLGTTTYEVACNKVANSKGIDVNLFKGKEPLAGGIAANFTGTVYNNTIGLTGVSHSGGGAGATALNVDMQGRGTHTVLIKNNVIRQYGEAGIRLNNVDNNSSAAVLNATVIGNTTIGVDSDAFTGIFVVAGAAAGTDGSNITNLKLGGAGGERNDFTLGDPANSADVFLQHGVPASTFNLSKGASVAATADQVVKDNNIATITVFTDSGINLVAGVPTLPPAINEACSAPPLLFGPGGVEKAKMKQSDALTGTSIATASQTDTTVKKHSQIVTTAPASQPSQSGLLKQADLDSVVDVATARWEATGLSAEQVATLRKLRFEVAALSNLRLGEASGNRIRVSSDAGGNGWFIDASAQSDLFFAKNSSTTRSYTDPAGAPAGRIDLLTAIMHEMGHALGLNDSYLEQDRDSLMYGYLTKGERRLPGKDQARGATPHTGGEMHFLNSPVVVGTLPSLKSVVVTYTITISPTTASSISNQGTVSGSNFSNVLTDDPTVGGATDPTVTQVEQPPVVVDIAPSVNEDQTLTFTAAMFIAGFSDPNAGDTLQSVKITSLPTNGTLKLGAVNVAVNDVIPSGSLGTLNYKGNADYNGADSFGWNASDGTLFAVSGATVNITVNAVNDVPSFTKGSDQTVLEDAGAQSVSGWATAISSGPANESSQVVNFIVSNNNNALFSTQPAVSAAGDLTYTPTANANGTAIVSVSIHDNGGTLNGGVDTSAVQTFNINVTAVNDAPTLNAISDPAQIPQNSGQQTVSLSGISSGPPNESAQTLSVTALSDNTGVIPNPTVSYTSPNTTGSLSYTPVAGQSGTAHITVTVTDNGGTANSGVNTFSRQFTVTVVPPTCVTPPSNMVGWYPGDGNFSDIAGPTFENGTPNGAVNFVAGEVGQAFSFAGASFVTVPANTGALNIIGNQLTIDGWIKPTANAGAVYFGKTANGANDYLLLLDAGQISGIIKTGGVEKLVRAFADYPTNSVPFVPPPGQFTHIALTYDGAFIRMYANGAQVSQDAETGNIDGDAVPFNIGGRSGSLFFTGAIDEVEVFTAVLTQPQIQEIYLAGIAGKCRPALQLTGAASRKTHGATPFDLPLPLSGAPGVECRIGQGASSNDHTLVFTFSNPVVSGTASVTVGAGSLNGAPTFLNNTMTVNLTGVTNAQQIKVKLSTVTDAVGQVLADTEVTMNVLLGDVNGDGFVLSGDYTATRAKSGTAVDGTTFIYDVNVDGSILAADYTTVRQQSGTQIP